MCRTLDRRSGRADGDIDANPVATHKSCAYVHELLVGQGFKAPIKPESWTATHTADHVVRGVSTARRAQSLAR